MPANIHSATEWLYTRAITLGCAALLYCPNDFVTRAQMALFMNRLGSVLSLRYINLTDSPGALDVDAGPTVCATGAYTPTYPQRAKVDGWVSWQAAGALATSVRTVYSVNGGTTWLTMPNPGNWWARAGASLSTEWAHGNHHGVLDMVAGTAYNFGIIVARDDAGTNDITTSRCQVVAQISNRNPDGAVPDAATTRPATGREGNR